MAAEKRFMVEFNCFSHVCNLSCAYCTDTNQYEIVDGVPFSQGMPLIYERGTELQRRLDQLILNVKERYDPAVFKILGGEVFLIKGMPEFITTCACLFPLVQVTSNGLLLHEHVSALSGLRNLHIQVTLDGNRGSMNRYRFSDQAWIDKIVRVISDLLRHNIPVELLAVLSDANAGSLMSYVKFVAENLDGVLFLPFVVRWTKAVSPAMKEHVADVETLLTRYSEFRSILGPVEYYEALRDFLRMGKRGEPCSIPKLIEGIDEKGHVRELCPCIPVWSKTALWDLREGTTLAREYLQNNNGFVSGLCYSCFDHFDLYNVALSKKCGKNGLRSVSVFRHSEVWNRFEECRCGIRPRMYS